MKLETEKQAIYRVVILPEGETAERVSTLQEAGAYARTYNDLMDGSGKQAVIAVSDLRAVTFSGRKRRA